MAEALQRMQPGTRGGDACPLERARQVARVIERDADEVERTTRITPAIHQALLDSGLIWLALPRAFGGEDADIATCLAVVEEIARADGSSGWTFFVNLANLSGLFPYFSDEQLAELFSPGRPPVMAGQLTPAGRSERVEGGYRVRGDHSFASGCAHAEWICAASIELDADGAPVLKPDGMPQIRVALLRRDEVEFRENWDVMGLAGTASYDFTVHPRILPDSRMLNGDVMLPQAEALRGNAMLRMGALVAAYSMHSACALGIAKRAIEEIAALASRKTRVGYAGTVAEDPVFRTEFAGIDIAYRSTREHLFAEFSRAEAKVAGGSPLDADDHAVLRQTATWAHARAGEIVGKCFRWAGTTPVRNPSVLGRCQRDILAANAHMLFDEKTMTDAGPVAIRRWLATGAA